MSLPVFSQSPESYSPEAAKAAQIRANLPDSRQFAFPFPGHLASDNYKAKTANHKNSFSWFRFGGYICSIGIR